MNLLQIISVLAELIQQLTLYLDYIKAYLKTCVQFQYPVLRRTFQTITWKEEIRNGLEENRIC